ncbi:hypothetical protein HDU97_001964 [Phlyctochytrium planicorne]|nr:hypothetical protein HDU97_001964 [Phlyctochytrium planicorne]
MSSFTALAPAEQPLQPKYPSRPITPASKSSSLTTLSSVATSEDYESARQSWGSSSNAALPISTSSMPSSSSTLVASSSRPPLYPTHPESAKPMYYVSRDVSGDYSYQRENASAAANNQEDGWEGRQHEGGRIVPYDRRQHPAAHYQPSPGFTRPSFDPLVDILCQINRSFVLQESGHDLPRQDSTRSGTWSRSSVAKSYSSPKSSSRGDMSTRWNFDRDTSPEWASDHDRSDRSISPRRTKPQESLERTLEGGPKIFEASEVLSAKRKRGDENCNGGKGCDGACQPDSAHHVDNGERKRPQNDSKSSVIDEDPDPVIREMMPLTDPSLFGYGQRQPDVSHSSTLSSRAWAGGSGPDSNSLSSPHVPSYNEPNPPRAGSGSPPVEDWDGVEPYDESVEWKVMDRFFKSKAESIIEVIHRPTFVSKVTSRLPVLRYAVCAYCAHHSYPKAPYHVVRKYYVKARELAKASVDTPSFQALQALVLLRALAMAMSDNTHGFFFLEAALKMSTELGLKVEWKDGRVDIISTLGNDDDVDFLELKKCWMACYFHDRMAAIASGQPHFLPVIGGVHDFTVMDIGDTDENSTKNRSSEHAAVLASRSNNDPLDHLMKLLDIAFTIHRAAKRPISTEDELLERWDSLEIAEARLSSWAFQVPVWMLSEPTLEWCIDTFRQGNNGKNVDIPWSALTVLFMYHSLRCFLHRPRLSLEAALTDAAGGIGGLGYGGQTDINIVKKLEGLGIPGAVEATAESAFIIARTTAKILTADPAMRDMNPPFAFCLTTVGIALGDLAKRRGTYLLAGGVGGSNSGSAWPSASPSAAQGIPVRVPAPTDALQALALASSVLSDRDPAVIATREYASPAFRKSSFNGLPTPMATQGVNSSLSTPSTVTTARTASDSTPSSPYNALLLQSLHRRHHHVDHAAGRGMSPGREGLTECREGLVAILGMMKNLVPYWNVMQFVILLEGVLANARKWEDNVTMRSFGLQGGR